MVQPSLRNRSFHAQGIETSANRWIGLYNENSGIYSSPLDMSRHLYWSGIFHFHGGVAGSCNLFESSEISCPPEAGIPCISTYVCYKFYVFTCDLHSDRLKFYRSAEKLAAVSFLLGTNVYHIMRVGFLLCRFLLWNFRILYLIFQGVRLYGSASVDNRHELRR